MDKTEIRNASTVVAIRNRSTEPSVLMGQRGAKAAFMPNKFVFPGGAVDAGDTKVALATAIAQSCQNKLAQDTPQNTVHALQVAAIRELWEETGLILGAPGHWHGTPPRDWADFAMRERLPSAQDLSFIFRAITPPGRPRRFDARFFLIEAEKINGDLDDFSQASDELSHLQWIPIDKVRQFDLPFITEVVLAEVVKALRTGKQSDSVPFFKNDDEHNLFLRLGETGLR